MEPPAELTRVQSRNVDRVAINQYGFPGIVLMENAGRGCVDCLLELEPNPVVIVAAGVGNNGGDGYVIARHLSIRGLPVKLVKFGDHLNYSEDSLANHQMAGSCDFSIVDFDEANLAEVLGDVDGQTPNVFVDALLGTGATGAPRGGYATMIRAANERQWKRLAVDIPSGLDADTGVASDPTLRADMTCTFVRPKVGFSKEAAREWVGQVQTVSIGIPDLLVSLAAYGPSDW